jgi:hypothetical protein
MLFLKYFVTCYGRMRSNEELFKIDDRVLSFDTDSIIFISKENHYGPESADYLGEFTNEIKSDYYKEDFVSAGSKNYGYKINNGQTSFKIKGFGVKSGFKVRRQLVEAISLPSPVAPLFNFPPAPCFLQQNFNPAEQVELFEEDSVEMMDEINEEQVVVDVVD